MTNSAVRFGCRALMAIGYLTAADELRGHRATGPNSDHLANYLNGVFGRANASK